MNSIAFDFTGTAALVTGGTSGIGHAIASAFADAGAAVTVTGTRAAATDYDTDLSRFGFRSLDLTDGAAVDALAAGTGSLDVLVNCAGATLPAGLDEWHPDGFALALATNLTGTTRLTTALRPALAASRLDGGASVVHIVSMAAFRAVPIVPGYTAAKAGLAALTRTLAVAWATDGIRVNAVAPGLIDTPMTAPMQAFPPMLDHELAHIAMGRMGTVDDIAPAVLYLCTAAARYVTGTILAVDGGYLAV